MVPISSSLRGLLRSRIMSATEPAPQYSMQIHRSWLSKRLPKHLTMQGLSHCCIMEISFTISERSLSTGTLENQRFSELTIMQTKDMATLQQSPINKKTSERLKHKYPYPINQDDVYEKLSRAHQAKKTTTFLTATIVPDALCLALKTLPQEPFPSLQMTSKTFEGGFESSDSSKRLILDSLWPKIEINISKVQGNSNNSAFHNIFFQIF